MTVIRLVIAVDSVCITEYILPVSVICLEMLTVDREVLVECQGSQASVLASVLPGHILETVGVG